MATVLGNDRSAIGNSKKWHHCLPGSIGVGFCVSARFAWGKRDGLPKMKYHITLAGVLFVGLTSSADAQSEGSATTETAAVSDTETTYWVAHQKADPRFITSIERKGPCKIPGPPLPTEAIRVPWQIYPKESVERHEEGTVRMQLIFDADWCVRKASIVQSTKFWRLDDVSLKWAMTIKWSPKKTLFTSDGEPTVTFPIAWGASQGKR